MSNRSQKLPTIVSKVEPDVRRFLERVREIIDGLDGSIETRVRTVFRDHYSSKPSPDPSPTPSDPITPIPFPKPEPEKPTQPARLDVRAYTMTIVLDWDYGPFGGYKHTEVWFAPYPDGGPAPTIVDATLLATSVASSYHHAVEENAHNCYWIRYVNTNDDKGPWNAEEGTCGTTALLEEPTQLTNLHTETSDSGVFVFWDRATYMGHKHTELRVAETNVGDPELAAFLDYASGYFYSHAFPAGEARYYWARHINSRDVAGEWYSTEGVEGASRAIDTPPAPTGVTGTIVAEQAVISWDNPTYFGHKETRIYHGTSASFPGGSPARSTSATTALVPIDVTRTNCFWVKHVNIADAEGPAQSDAPVCVVPDVEFPDVPAWDAHPVGGAFETILLNWTFPSYKGHAYTEVWAGLTSSRSSASKVGTSLTSTFSYQPGDTRKRWFWLRNANLIGQVSGFTTQDVSYALSELPDAYIDTLDEAIQGTDFYQTLESAYAVRVDAGNAIHGYGLALDANNRSDFAVRSNRFYIAPPIGTAVASVIPFVVTTTGQCYVDGAAVAGNQAQCAAAGGVWVDPGVYMDTAMIRNASITDAKIGNLSADKITAGTMLADRISGGTIQGDEIVVGSALKSANFVNTLEEQAGFKLAGNGSAIFNQVIVRGVVYASGGTFTGYISGATIHATDEFRTSGANDIARGEGMYVGRNSNNAFHFRVGNGFGDADKARIVWNDNTLRIMDSNNNPLLEAGAGTQNKVHITDLSADNITTGTLTATTEVSGLAADGSKSWSIRGDGTAEFRGALINGTLDSVDGVFTGSLSGATISADTTLSLGSAGAYGQGEGLWAGMTSGDFRLFFGHYLGGNVRWNGSGLYINDGSNVVLGVDGAGARFLGNVSIANGALHSADFRGDKNNPADTPSDRGWCIAANGQAAFHDVYVRVKRSDLDSATLAGNEGYQYINAGVSWLGSWRTVGSSPLLAYSTYDGKPLPAGDYIVTIDGTGYMSALSSGGLAAKTRAWLEARIVITNHGSTVYTQNGASQVCGIVFPLYSGQVNVGGTTYTTKCIGEYGNTGTFTATTVLRGLSEGAYLRGYIQARLMSDQGAVFDSFLGHIVEGRGSIHLI